MSYREPSDAAWQDAWTTTEALIVAMAAEMREADAEFLVVTITAGAQVHPDAEERRRFAASLGVTDLLYADRRIGPAWARTRHPRGGARCRILVVCRRTSGSSSWFRAARIRSLEREGTSARGTVDCRGHLPELGPVLLTTLRVRVLLTRVVW